MEVEVADKKENWLGRCVSHIKEACVSCRKLKVRCSGKEPCDQCRKRGKEDTCFYDGGGRKPPPKRRRRKKPVRDSDSDEDEDNDDDDDDEDWDGGKSLSTTTRGRKRGVGSSSGSSNVSAVESQMVRTSPSFSESSSAGGSNSSSNVRESLAIVAERLLADDTTGKFLMDIFIRRIHPHTFVLASTSPTFVFETALDKSIKASDAIQRDAGLAMACRICGHEILGELLVRRMEKNYENVKDEPVSQDAYSAIALLSTLIMTENISKGIEMVRRSFAMHKTLHPCPDPVGSTCEFLESLSLHDNNDYNNDDSVLRPLSGVDLANFVGCNEANGMSTDWEDVSKEEITAHVQMATSQLVNWSETLPDMSLRMLVMTFIARATGIALPPMRPPFTMQMCIMVDLHLLGSMVPPYITQILRVHDPNNKFAVSAIFKPCAALGDSLDAFDLSEEIAATLLRRVLVCRILLFQSGLNMDVISSFLISLEITEVIIQWRSGNIDRADKIGHWILDFVEKIDLNFWPPMVAQYVFCLGTIFYEMRDAMALMRTVAVLDMLRRSQPTVVIGIGVLKELHSKMLE